MTTPIVTAAEVRMDGETTRTESPGRGRLILLTTRAQIAYTDFAFPRASFPEECRPPGGGDVDSVQLSHEYTEKIVDGKV